ncbi:MAG: energy transducer TonB [Pseudobdellovibrionaceae bacterium]
MDNRWTLPSIFILSFILHGMMSLSMIGLLSLFPPPKGIEIAEIEFISPSDSTNKSGQQIVRQAQVPENIKTLKNDQEARFLSEQQQRVQREQRAQLSGKTQNAITPSQKPSLKDFTQTSKEISRFQDKMKTYDSGDVEVKKSDDDFQQALIQKQPSFQPQRPSTVGEALPLDLAVGPMTALNTDRLTYYSFYARIEDLIRYRWESRIWNAIDSYDQNYLRSVITQRDWTTQAEFLIKPDGTLVKATLMKPSGIQKFDQAALSAFKEAAIFPNPPKELIQSDGLIHLKYSFNVSYRR